MTRKEISESARAMGRKGGERSLETTRTAFVAYIRGQEARSSASAKTYYLPSTITSAAVSPGDVARTVIFPLPAAERTTAIALP